MGPTTPENIPLRYPDLTMVLPISYHLWTVMVREITLNFCLVTCSFPSSPSATSAKAPHRDSRLPSEFRHHSCRSPPVLATTLNYRFGK